MRRQLVQFVQYAVGGSVYFYSGYGMFALCYSGLGWQWWQAKLLGDTTGLTLNYLVQRNWAFARKDLRLHEGRNRLRYTTISIIDLTMDYGLIGGLLWMGITPYIGMYISSGFFTVWNYCWYRWWVFTGVEKEYNNHNHEHSIDPTDQKAARTTDLH